MDRVVADHANYVERLLNFNLQSIFNQLSYIFVNIFPFLPQINTELLQSQP